MEELVSEGSDRTLDVLFELRELEKSTRGRRGTGDLTGLGVSEVRG